MKEKFNWKQFIKAIAVIAIPVAIQTLLSTTGSMIDTMMIGKMGEKYVGAVGLCGQFSSLMFACYWGFVGGGMMFFSQFWGARDDDGIDWSYGITLSIMFAISMVFVVLAHFFPYQVMSIYTDKLVTRNIGTDYLSIVGFAYPMIVVSIAMSSVLRSTERVKIPLYASIVSVLTNLFLNWVFIYGNLGAPELGVKGAALATTCAAFVNMVVTMLLAKATGYPYLFHFRKHFAWNKERIKAYLKKCFPIICNELLIGVGNTVLAIVLGHQSEEAINALAVFRTLEGFVIGFFSGFSNAASILVGTCVGSGELKKAYERAKRLVLICASSIFMVCLLLVAVHSPILHIMSLSGESFRLGRGILIIYCVAAVVRMCNWIQNDTYRAAGDAAFGTILEITFMYLMLIPCVYLGGMVFHLPFFLVFALCYIDEPIRFVLMQVHMYSGKWIKPVTPEGKAAVPAFMEELKKGASIRMSKEYNKY